MLKRFCDKCGVDITASEYWIVSMLKNEGKSVVAKELCPDCKIRILQIIDNNED